MTTPTSRTETTMKALLQATTVLGLATLSLSRGALAADPWPGYTLYAPINSTTTYLIDNDGATINSWDSSYRPGLSAYLLDDGSLMRTASSSSQSFNVGGAGGRVEQYNWDGDLLWEYDYSSADHRLHHDIEVLPNGNVLMVAWEQVTESDAIAAGRSPSLLSEGELWPDHIIEVEPTGSSGGNIVWEWHAWDHLVQDYDSSQGQLRCGGRPSRADRRQLRTGPRHRRLATHQLDRLQRRTGPDPAVGAQFQRIWIIDHSTTTEEAASHAGGSSGLGGDLLYRWGNPQAYDAGTAADQVFYGQHDAEWIDDGLPGDGDILVFNNGNPMARAYSSVDEITPPLEADGSYTLTTGEAYGPDDLTWSYTADPASDFFATNISGAQRLPNGNTLISDGPGGQLFEVTPDGEVVWEYDVGGQVFRGDRYGLDYVPQLTGDFNGDGTVDAADYTVWRDGLGTVYTEADYDVWRQHFGQLTDGTGTTFRRGRSRAVSMGAGFLCIPRRRHSSPTPRR